MIGKIPGHWAQVRELYHQPQAEEESTFSETISLDRELPAKEENGDWADWLLDQLDEDESPGTDCSHAIEAVLVHIVLGGMLVGVYVYRELSANPSKPYYMQGVGHPMGRLVSNYCQHAPEMLKMSFVI
jgi:hypothetical protein